MGRNADIEKERKVLLAVKAALIPLLIQIVFSRTSNIRLSRRKLDTIFALQCDLCILALVVVLQCEHARYYAETELKFA